MKGSKFLYWSTRISVLVWTSCIIAVIILVGISTQGFSGTVQDTKLGKSDFFMILLLSLVGLGVLSFITLVLSIIVNTLLEKNIVKFEKSLKGIFKFLIKTFLILSILPLFILYSVSGLKDLILKIIHKEFKFSYLKPANYKDVVGRLVGIIIISVTLLPVWIGGYWIIGQQLGYINESIPSTGGSMYPTLSEGENITGMFRYQNGLNLFGKKILGHKIGKGDIVVVEDDKTRKSTKKLHGYAAGWIKRVIGIGGDTLEIRDGLVYLNNQPIKEPYIAKPHSTFGQTFLKECSKVTIPGNSIFVMGDNRKVSGDSREVGFFNYNDVDYVLPLKNQKGDLIKNWRNTSKDFDESSKIKLDKEKYLELLNKKRKDASMTPLKYQQKLELSAAKRGEVILKFDDFSYEATRSGYTMENSMRDSDYSNIIWNEAFMQGYYEAEELIEYYFEFPEWKKFLLEKDFQEVGISEVEGFLNGCPTQVIVQHFAGYIPPNYTQDVVESWRNTVNNLNSIIPSWEEARKSSINQDELKKLLDLLYRERTIASNILSKMESNKWLSKQEEDSIKEFENLSNESSTLADKLNSR